MVVVGWGGLFDYSVTPGPGLVKSQMSGAWLGQAKVEKSLSVGWGGGLSDYSISSWPWLAKIWPIPVKRPCKVRGKARAKELDNKLIFGQGCQTILASNPSVLPQTRVKYTKTPNRRLTPTSNSHFYTTTTNQLKLIFGLGCQTKLASNPSLLPQTRVKYTKKSVKVTLEVGVNL